MALSDRGSTIIRRLAPGIRSFNRPRSLPTTRRWNSSAQPTAQKEVSPHGAFYKTFGRPVAKVLLMATLSYQLAYWLWVKLEKDEIKAERQAEIVSLENQLKEAMEKREAEKNSPSPVPESVSSNAPVAKSSWWPW